MNTDKDWLQPPKRIFKGTASHPYLVNKDRNVIFQIEDKYFLLDEELVKQQITQEEFEQLRDGRYVLEQNWQIRKEYRGMPGIWITDPAELNWVQLRDTTDLRSILIMPINYSIYCWGKEFAGLLELIPTDTPYYSISLHNNRTAVVGDLFDVYEKKLSPISQEVIGYKEDKFKGTVRVVKIIDGHLVCEFQTKIYQSGIFKDDAAVSQKNPETIGSIL